MRRSRGQSREEVFSFVRARVIAGAPPSVREVQQALGFASVQSARAHLTALVAEGRLVHWRGQARGYRLPDLVEAREVERLRPPLQARNPSRRVGRGQPGDPRLLQVPRLGRVQAGALQPAIEDVRGHLWVEAREPGASLFALEVVGESMREAGILPGDWVIVRRQPRAEAGDVVVALVGEEATVKTLRFEGRAPVLWPENPAFAPIRLAAGEELRILGKVIEVRRMLEGTEEGRVWLQDLPDAGAPGVAATGEEDFHGDA